MADMESQLNAVLGNPEMMQKIMAMAQSLQSGTERSEAPTENISPFGDMDLGLIQKLSGLAGKSNIDSNQQNLLRALTPYINRERITKLEKAMRAARLASFASSFFGSSGLFG